MFNIRLADINIGINNSSNRLKDFFNDYLTNGNCEFVVAADQGDIEYEKNLSSEAHSDFEFLKLAIYRKISEKLPEYNAFLIHGSALYINKEATLLAGISGSGKSTHASLLREYFNAKMINDDKPLIRIINKEPFVYGTPYNGKHHLSCNTKKPIKNIIFIKQSKENKIVEICKDESFPLVYAQSYRPLTKEGLAKTIDLVNTLNTKTKQYYLYCDISKEAAETSYEIIK